VRPDILTLAKGLGGGLPIGSCIGIGAAATLLTPGSHGSTFGGNPVSCAAALAVLTTIESEGLLAGVRAVGAELHAGLLAIDSPLLLGVRGSGLWRGLVLAEDLAAEVESVARGRGLLVNAVKPNVIRLAPPLIVSSEEVAEAVGVIAAALAEVSAAQPSKGARS
jgi:acetylornithine aminotransferase